MEDYPEYADYTMQRKREIIRKKLDEAIKLVLQYDLNNVGMSAPGDITRAELLRNIKGYYDE